MRLLHSVPVLLLAFAPVISGAADDYKPGPDSLPQAGVPKGELIKDQYTAKEGSVFPGTGRDYTIYLPAGLDKSRPAPFMVFQDGVIYNAPVVFDNLIAKKEIPPLIGIFIKPGVVPAANDNALPRFNRSYEYDSVTDTYSRFLIDEFLPAITSKHGLHLSQKPDDAAISGNSSGGICAFMVAWHRPDRFRRVFTGVGTYVGIHGADQLPVLLRKMEPKPLRVYLQSGTNDNNLYCGDWWMANQTMERSLTWAGYDVNHTWGEGGHNAKHATAIFPEVLRWLWKGWPEEELKANPRGDSKWLGYGVLGEGGWEAVFSSTEKDAYCVASNPVGVVAISGDKGEVRLLKGGESPVVLATMGSIVHSLCSLENETWLVSTYKFVEQDPGLSVCKLGSKPQRIETSGSIIESIAVTKNGRAFIGIGGGLNPPSPNSPKKLPELGIALEEQNLPLKLCLSPDQTQLYGYYGGGRSVSVSQILADGTIQYDQDFYQLEGSGDNNGSLWHREGLCVDTEGRLYVATALGIQVCDQAGRVNFIIPTPQQPYDVCFGGKDLGELFIACGDKIYKRAMKVHGIVSGQMTPIKPAAPHL